MFHICNNNAIYNVAFDILYVWIPVLPETIANKHLYQSITVLPWIVIDRYISCEVVSDKARVVTLCKSDGRENMNNRRPTSILPVL